MKEAQTALAPWLSEAGEEATSSRELPSWMAPPLTPPPNQSPVATTEGASLQQLVADVGVGLPASTLSSFQPAAPETPPEIAIAGPVEPSPAEVMLRLEADGLRSALASSVNAMGALRENMLRASEKELVRLSMVVAQRIVRRELTTQPDIVAQWAREGIESLAAGSKPLVLAVSADVAPHVSPSVYPGLELLVDPGLGEWSCEVRGKDGRVEAGLNARVVAVSEAMGTAEDE